jgi:hypothetical protein
MRVLAAVLLMAAAPALPAGCDRLTPVLVRELPAAAIDDPTGVAWLNDTSVAVSSDSGVHEYVLASGAYRLLVSTRDVPEGLPRAEDVAADNRTLVAFNNDYADVGYDLEKSRIRSVHSGPEFQVVDLAVHGDTIAFVGYPTFANPKAEQGGALWVGRLGASRDTFRALYKVSDDNLTRLRGCFTPVGGGTVVQSDGTIAMFTPAEPGVHRFRADGTRLPSLGGGLSELVVERLDEFRRKYAGDVVARYRDVLNAQPIADDLIDTAQGLALVVRRSMKDRVWWELWFPGPGGGTRHRVRLAMEDRRAVGGHVRCSGRGNRVACIFNKALVPTGMGSERGHLMVFDLTKCSP